MAVRPMFFCSAMIGMPLAFGAIILMEGFSQVNVVALFLAVLVGAAVGFLYVWLLSLCFTTELTSEGVFGHSFWGIRRFIRWQDIANVRPFNFLNLRCLRLYPPGDTGPTWIALFQAHKTEFMRELQRLVPPDSPVRNYLR
jgi:hypothetical protein